MRNDLMAYIERLESMAFFAGYRLPDALASLSVVGFARYSLRFVGRSGY